MGFAYVPGLKVAEDARIIKTRTAPIPGKVLVAEGQDVKYSDTVIEVEIPGNVHPVNIANQLNISPEEVTRYCVVQEKDAVTKDQVIAQTKPLIKFFTAYLRSPVDGTIETISPVTGQMLIREKPRLLKILAYINGKVARVQAGTSVTIELNAALIQGIFGIGGEGAGTLQVLAKSPTDTIDEEQIPAELKGKIAVGGAFITQGAIKKAMSAGAAAVVTGGVDDTSIKEIVGRDIGVAITGFEEIPTSIIVTEGFGRIDMARRTFDILKKFEGELASFSGATQIRAGVQRPEIIIHKKRSSEQETAASTIQGLSVGMQVRIIREPLFGIIGTVEDLPAKPVEIETGALTRIIGVKLPSGDVKFVPRSNVEIIEK